MTRKITLPNTYGRMLLFLFSGSGSWAIISVTLIALIMKTLLGDWHWWDAVILLLFFLGRGIIEWMIHVWIYHAKPLPLLKIRLTGSTHQQHIEHHENPADLSRLLITWKGVISLSSGVFLISLLALKSINMASTILLGFIIVGLMIEVVHLICHCRIPHRYHFMQRLVWLHRHHHHQDSGHYFGVSSSLGDKLFGSYPPLQDPIKND